MKAFTFTSRADEPARDSGVLTINDWRTFGACRDSDPELFFPVGTTGIAATQIRQAAAICSACSIQDECLSYALETNQEAGIWGGYPEDDRRRLRKRWLADRRKRRQAS